ncbi:MAG: hypothetical protein COB26_06625 [Piscirickettsiaceae bacterium]|nr:MAG: hypothetical protein COB26_06625 [Piscirickettsiaceae bacterium]
MRKALVIAALCAATFNSYPVFANDDIDALKRQLATMKQNYETRLYALEIGLKQAQLKANLANVKSNQVEKAMVEAKSNSPRSTQNSFNPAISLILDGRYASYSNNPDDYALAGFALGEEAGLDQSGFSVGESEITLSSTIDDKFYGQMTLAFSDEGVEVEEIFFQTLGLSDGLTVKGGRFFSGIGYLNQQHAHAWEFADAPLIYRGLFGNQLSNDGLQVTYLMPTDTFFQVGGEVGNGTNYPSSGSNSGVGSWSVFTNIGDDIGIESSWQLGLSHWEANHIKGRESQYLGDSFAFDGDGEINGLSFVYKWAPRGNPKNRNFMLQYEYFQRDEKGVVASDLFSSSYRGEQSGWYTQAIYQFSPVWRTGLRFDRLSSDNSGNDLMALNTVGLLDNGHHPERLSAMLEWIPSEFSRIRLQANHDNSTKKSDNQLLLQYTFSLGSHGAHQY